MRLIQAAAAAALASLLFTAPGTSAPSPALQGDWIGAVDAPLGPDHMGVRFRRAADGTWQGVFDAIDQGSRNIPIADVEATSGHLAFNVPGFEGRYEGQWDQAHGQWTGTFRQPMSSTPLSFKRGRIPPAPRIAGLDGDWRGALGGKAPQQVVLHIRTTRQDGTLATIDNLTTNIGGIPFAHIRRIGSKVTLEMTVLGVLLDGALDPKARTLTGVWTQNNQPAPVTLTRDRAP